MMRKEYRHENTPRIETPRLILRKFTEDDIDDMLPLYSDTETNTFLPWFPIVTREEMRGYLHKNIFPQYERDTAYSYAVELKAERRVIGYVHVDGIGESNDMGYALRKEFWHRGIMTEACAAVIDVLRRAGFPFVTATHDVNNPNSGKVMRKTGMTYRYSYRERWQPKDIWVVFRMYELDLDGTERTYEGYRKKYQWFIENIGDKNYGIQRNEKI